jgi:hypothetical protein
MQKHPWRFLRIFFNEEANYENRPRGRTEKVQKYIIIGCLGLSENFRIFHPLDFSIIFGYFQKELLLAGAETPPVGGGLTPSTGALNL